MKYYFKVWLFTLVVSPVLIILFLVYFKSGKFSDIIAAFPIWFFSVLFGSVLSLPALFLFSLLYKDLRKRNMADWLKKSIYAIVGVALLWVTFYLMNSSLFNDLSSLVSRKTI
jgi:hypothetical protein